jgi:hypothetical protein
VRRAALLALAIGLACKAEVGPRPTGIAPEHGPADVPVQVTIRGSAFQPQVVTDFEHTGSSVVDARFSARLGSVALRDVQLAPDGTLAATVPAGLPVGVHDLTVTRPDGRKGSLVAAYRALGADELGEVVASYRIELTGNPPFQAYQPVQVTITALDSQGEVATDFGGAVALEDGTGTAVPARAGLFERGRWTGLVEIRSGTPSDALVASDASGHRGTSPDFAVLPSAPARLAFGSPPSQLTAGACSGAIELRLLDAFGDATAAPAPLAISIDAGPDAGLYSDEACTVALDPTVPAYGGVLSLRFRTPHAGPLALKAAAPGLGEALATAVEVVPGPPAGLAFFSQPRTLDAGACTSASVEAQDAFGNSVQSPGLPVALAATPAAGLAFYGDRDCTGRITSVDSDGSLATFWFSGTVPEIVTVIASTPGLASASQDERVVPEGQATRIAFLTLPLTVTAGACSPTITLQAQDSYGNAVAGATAVQVTLDSTAQVVPDLVLGGLLFFADASCAFPVATVVIPAGAATADVHSRGGAAGSYLVTARGEGLSFGSLAETVVAGPAASVSFTTAEQSVPIDSCSAPVGVAVRDSFGNPARPDGVPLTVEAPTSLGLYGDDACAEVLGGPLVVAENGTAQFWFKGSQPGLARVSVWLGGAASDSQDELVQ